MPPDEAARITVSRKHADDVGDRQIIISVDGDKIATLLFGQEVTRDLVLGPHRIKATTRSSGKTWSWISRRASTRASAS
jgi:hypothetical protein